MVAKNIPSIIAIDGPAASGKSSIGQDLAKELGYLFLDTGAMYRAVTWAALNRKIDVYKEKDVSDLGKKIKINIRPPTIADGRMFDLLVDGMDITWQIKDPLVNENVSQVSTYSGVRSVLTKQQRQIGRQGKIVMVGRDIGTVVLPKADLKIFLEASVKERARRRYQEDLDRGIHITYEEILDSMLRRDEIDSKRSLAPLKPAKDAIIIQTNGKGRLQVLEEILEIVHKK
jgi:cytidylate kinase